ncbi:hypothetical protein DEO72_LG8g1292 [Vigna unguiculata]|uniref:Uncharacterized protein n=1 Tax=Vigna unguiculata TaxID=3917 RepID=A0A4D6MQF2_VIGUN|nr:hypothetical protein DEO72_LG8g1292 [Vigna unguiculata]
MHFCNSSSYPTSSAPLTVPHTSHRPAHLRRTPPTILHSSDVSGHRFVACTALLLHRLHRQGGFRCHYDFFDQPSPPLHRRGAVHCHWSCCIFFFEQPSPTSYAVSFSLPAPPLHALSRRLLMNALLKLNEKMSVLLNFNKMKMNVWLKFNKMKLNVWLKLNLRKTSNLLGQFKKVIVCIITSFIYITNPSLFDCLVIQLTDLDFILASFVYGDSLTLPVEYLGVYSSSTKIEVLSSISRKKSFPCLAIALTTNHAIGRSITPNVMFARTFYKNIVHLMSLMAVLVVIAVKEWRWGV